MPNSPSSNDDVLRDQDALRDQLVAYLDGELPDDQAEAIESRLASDEAMREQLQGLDRVWNALDGLPKATVDDSFARTTIEMATVEAERDLAAMTAALPVQQRRRSYAMLGACVGALLLGFTFVRAAVTNPERQLVANLPAVYAVDILQEVSSPDFLRKLPDVAGPLLARADDDQLAEDLSAWQTVADGDTATRRAWVAELSDNDKAKLLEAARRYRRDLTPNRREAVDDAYEQIAVANDRDSLMATALAYESWLATQPASDQSRLRQMSENDRLAALSKLARDAERRNGRSLSAADSAALRNVVQSLAGTPELTRLAKIAEERLEWFEKRLESEDLPEDRMKQGKRMLGMFRGVLEWQEKSPAFAVQFLAMAAEGRRAWPSLQSAAELAEIREQAQTDWRTVEKKLIEALSPAGQKSIMLTTNESRRRERLVEFVRRASRGAMRSFDHEEFFASDSLTDADRHTLLGLPTEQMRKRLEELYVERVLGGFDQRRIPDPFRGGWPGRGGGDRRRDRERSSFQGPSGGRPAGPGRGREGRNPDATEPPPERGRRGPGLFGPGGRGSEVPN